MAKKMTQTMESAKCMCGGGCCGCGRNKLYLKALAGLVILVGGVGVMGFSGLDVSSWFNIWSVIGAYLLLSAALKMSG